jgi:hypothetical protein
MSVAVCGDVDFALVDLETKTHPSRGRAGAIRVSA